MAALPFLLEWKMTSMSSGRIFFHGKQVKAYNRINREEKYGCFVL